MVLPRFRTLSLVHGLPHPCSYIEDGRIAGALFLCDIDHMDGALYQDLMASGFRRSGAQIYRPLCVGYGNGCQECVAARVPVVHFQPSRNMQQTWRRNRDLSITSQTIHFNPSHFQLYQNYLAARHTDGPMDNPEPEAYWQFIWSPWLETVLVEFYQQQQLLMVAVVDILPDSLSAVYTFFEPLESRRRSLGTYAILWQIAEARRLGKNWLYLGYWIDTSPKMRYKSRFQPLEVYRYGAWLPWSVGANAAAPPRQL
ncbi:MAG: arginyltransferase [Magnetococcales bacterium]|nr:arginyltransferase [Magnetococcales bacterium]